MAIRNIIFDLGGVILNIDFNEATNAFKALGIENFDSYFNQYHANPLFKKLELGAVEESFYDDLRKAALIDASNESIDTAWNAMLLDFPAKKIEFLKELSTQYRLFLFSNTNAIHHAAFLQKFRLQFGYDFDGLFEKAYYSHLIGYRKPEIKAFQFVLNDSKLEPGETLFIDDTLPNVEAANKAGINGLLLERDEDLVDLLKTRL